jgi:hypothetical protein
VEVKAISEGNSTALEAFWSQAALQAEFHAKKSGHHPIAVVVADRITNKAADRLEKFASQHAPAVAVGIVDYAGLRRFTGDGLSELNAEPVLHREADRANSVAPKNLFSDLNQWLLKVLLAPELPEKMISAPRGEYRNATELSTAAGCSVMSAHRFLEELKSNGFLDESIRTLRVVQRNELLRRWSNVKSASVADRSYRLIHKRDLRNELDRYFPTDQACLGLFAAAHELGVGFVSVDAPYVLVEHKSLLPGGIAAKAAIREFMLSDGNDSVDLIVRVPKAAKSVFRAQVTPKGIPCCDIIQVWLDVSNHGSRGIEQADMIWERHLQKALGLSKNE